MGDDGAVHGREAPGLWDVAAWAPDGLLVVDPSGRVLTANHTAHLMFGYADGTLAGLHVDDLVPTSARGRHAAHRAAYAERAERRVMAAGRLVGAVRADGSTFAVEIRLSSLPGVEGLVTCSVRDVDEHGRAQHLLHVQHVALEAAANAIVITDRAGHIQWVNPAFSRMTGYCAEEVVGRDPSFLKSGVHDGAFYRALWERVTAGHVWEGEITNRRKDGTLYVEEQTIAPVRGSAGEISHFIAIKQDVTERRRVEGALREAKEAAEQAARAKSEFLANTSHELRTPLNAVIGLSELLLESDLSARQRAMLDTVRESGETLLALINDLLDLSKLEAGRLDLDLQPVEVEPLFAAAVAQLAPRAQGKGIELLWAIDPGVPAWIVADGLRLSQVFLNLAGNAVKFTDHGEVVVRLSLAAPAAPPGGATRLRVSVEDTGLGIPADRRHLLFKTFSQLEADSTRRFGGTGLGLAISKTLAERMGGGIEVESEGVPGRGSRFTFELDARVAPPGGSAVGHEPILVGRHVGIAACHRALAEALAAQVRALGAVPVAVEPRARPPASLDAVIVDESCSAPVTEDSSDGPPVIVLLRMGARSDDELAAAFASLTKPVRPRALREALRQVIDPTAAFAPAPAPDLAPDPLPRMRVLVADDSPVGQQVVMAQLTRLGVRADVVGDGAAAIAAIASRRYDLALLDVNMPEMDGLEVARAVRALPHAGADTRMIALTASAMAGDRERCLAAGMDGYLSKPVRLRQLEATIRRVFASREPRSSQRDLPPASDDAPFGDAIDEGTVRELREELGEAALLDVMQTFCASGQSLLAAAHEALARDDMRALHLAVHTIKGSAAACGAPAVARLAAEAERLAAAHDTAALTRTLAVLARAFDAVVKALASAPPPPARG